MTNPSERLDRSEALHLQVARNIRNDIEAGALRDGDVLPSTRELAERWAVSVFTINEAMKHLAEEGLVESKSRSKRLVRTPDKLQRNELRLNKPRVIFVGGYVGSGKTQLGRVLARLTGWSMIDKDTISRPVVEAALEVMGLSPNDRESSKYGEMIRPREYESLLAAGTENVECGNSVILTAPFLREFRDAAWLNRAQASFEALNASTTFVWVYCDVDTMHAYIRHRGAARDAFKLADWPGYLKTIDVDFRPPVPHTFIDNCASSVPLQDQAKDLIHAVVRQGKR